MRQKDCGGSQQRVTLSSRATGRSLCSLDANLASTLLTTFQYEWDLQVVDIDEKSSR